MLEIKGLPEHIRLVPPSPSSPDDELRAEKREAWSKWLVDVAADNEKHMMLFANAGQDMLPELIALELSICRDDPAYWLIRWGWIYEPRASLGRGGERPFIPLYRQIELIRFFQHCLEQDGADADGLVSKCRDVGASWTMCAFALWGWLFKSPWQVRLVSRKEDLVDAKSPDSLFWKIDFLLSRLPNWMVPNGFSRKKHRIKLLLSNPENGNSIAGEATTSNSIRGGRATWVGYDEAAFIDGFMTTWSAAANSTNHRFAVSTESLDHGPDFYNERMGVDITVTPSVFTFDWWEHPEHDDHWYETMKQRYAADMHAFAREVLRDARAGSATWVYPLSQDRDIDPSVRYQPGNPIYVGIDPGVDDQTAIVWWQEDPVMGTINVLDAYENRQLPADYYGSILAGSLESGAWNYDEDAMRIIEWTKYLPVATYYGDTYGHNRQGATMDSFYSRLHKYGIYVNVDRTPNENLTAFRNEARTYKGRREAMRELLPRMRFSDTPGSRRFLRAMQNHKFKPDDRATTGEPERPLHDWTSHLVSAGEFIAVNLKLSRQVKNWTLASPKKPNRPNQPRWSIS